MREHASPGRVKFNCITLREPRKLEYAAFRSSTGPRPERRALAIVLRQQQQPQPPVHDAAGGGGGMAVREAIVNLTRGCVEEWRVLRDVAPTLTLEDLDVMERVARRDARVVEACREIGIDDMSSVFLDAWAIGIDARWGFERRLQQGLAYWRASPTDNQYAHPLDFSVVIDSEAEEVLAVDVRRVGGRRTPVPRAPHNYLPEFVGAGYRPRRLRPIDVTQPEGVSFSVRGSELAWAGLRMHVGFNYREGIVLYDVRIDDPYEGRERALFHRISVVEMVVPYGCPDPPHHRKHAFDVGEYGAGLMTNSLRLGCDCKGAIHYMDAVLSTSRGRPAVVPKAVCIHEEDNGLLYKHTDYRDGAVVSARDRRLVVSQIITAANYEYGFYHVFSLDGTYRLEVRLTGMLNTYCLHPAAERAAPWGTEVAPGVTAHNHQHIFSLRVDPEVDGPSNSVVQCDAVAAEAVVGSAENPFGNAFLCRRTPLRTAREGAADYCHETSRTWDIVNPGRLHPSTGAPVAYKIVNTQCPGLLAKPGSVVHQRAAFARRSLWVVPYRDYELFPAGDYVCQSTGDECHPHNASVLDWVARDEPIEDTDIVCYVQFGLTHFPRAEDFPIMPAEPAGVTLRASSFFRQNPALWVPPTAAAGDGSSRHAFAPASSGCCAADEAKHASRL